MKFKMGTTIRPELSKKNPYWIEKHRYYELKHFCLQYPIWKQAYNSLGGLYGRVSDFAFGSNKYNASSPTERIAIARGFYSDRMDMVEKTAKEADCTLSEYIVIGVTENMSYDLLRVNYDIPCCKDVYYDRYRRFFWLLNKARG
nr:MAG TPA: hypothetical protein [Caudoviricetes sp.]